MHQALVKNFIFPLHEYILGRRTFKILKKLEITQWYSREQLAELQLNKLKKLLNQAYENVPFYREIFNSIGVLPQDVRNFDDLKKIPFLTKEMIRENFEKFKATNIKKGLIRMNTGGSTGEPLIFYVDKNRTSYDKAANLRSKKWWGVDIGEREIALWGSPVELSTQDRLKNLRDIFFNTKLLSAFNMGEKQMFSYAKIIQQYQPKHIFGYPSSIYLLSRFLIKHKLDIKKDMVKVVFVTGEVLHPYQKSIIEGTFHCPVANGYGGRDGGFIAHECREGKLHISEDIIVEIVDENGKSIDNGKKGEIVITHLEMYAMPFIRYRMGDIAIQSQDSCKCGRKLPILSEIQGRSADFIITPDGKILHALSVIYPIRNITGIVQFKIIQKKIDHLSVMIVKNEQFRKLSEDELRLYFRKLLGENVEIEINYVNSIQGERSGKYRHVVSYIEPEVIAN